MKNKMLRRLVLAAAGLLVVQFANIQTIYADENTGLPLHGFADFLAGNSGQDAPEAQANTKLRGVSMGTVDLYLTPEFSGGVKSLIEIAFEPASKDGVNGLDVERLQVGYSFSDSLTLWGGRFHTPIGVWNTSFHHGAQLQTSIYRPRFIDFEDKGGLMPTHMIGLWAHGNTKIMDHTRFSYDFWAANGPRIVWDGDKMGLDPNFIRADRQGTMLGLNLGVRNSGLTVGVHAYTSPVNEYQDTSYALNANNGPGSSSTGGPIAKLTSSMMGAYVNYESDNLEFTAEYYNLQNTDETANANKKRSSNMYFAQVALPMGNWHTYARWEKTELDKNDPYFYNASSSTIPLNQGETGQLNAASYERGVLGVRYDIDAKSAIKIEYFQTKYNEILSSYSSQPLKWDTEVFQYAIRF